ncbi:MAG: heat-shock protein Hsp20 [Acidimicrobiales bacterium]|nr:heat-shock protein Hsp20 [Acidimicrobiales bacterium]
MLMRTDPFREWTPFSRLMDAPATPIAAMDAYRVGDVITVEFDLPGVDPDSIDIQIERGELRLQAIRRTQAPEGAQFLVRERPDATINRRVMLGDVLDVEHVDAEYHDGVLVLRIPLRETAKPRRISVRHEEHAGDQQAIPVEAK